MTTMVRPFVYETSSAPGTSTTINLAGSITGRIAWLTAFTTGSTIYYVMDDGTLMEWGSGTVTSGSPNTLARTTVIGNSAGTTARMNFTGTTRVYCAYPGDRIIALDAAGAVAIPAALTVGTSLAVTTSQTVGTTLAVGTAATVGTTLTVASQLLAAHLRGALAGMTLSRSSATVLGIAIGTATDSTNATSIFLASAFTKSTAGAWAAGTGNNGMGTALTIANNTWYHVFAIINAGAADVYFDTSLTAANKPASTTAFRRIGSFRTNGSAQIIDFVQFGDEFLWKVAVQDVSTTTLTTTSTLFSLTVPSGVQVIARMRVIGQVPNNGDTVLIQSPDETTQVANSPTGNAQFTAQSGLAQAGQLDIRTNTSGQIRTVTSTANAALYVVTFGWIDRRGRDD